MSKLVKGQTIFILPFYGRSFGEIKPVEIDTVGKKYFTLKDYPRKKFHIDNMTVVSEYSDSTRCYLTKEEYEQEKEVQELIDYISQEFRYSCQLKKLSLDKLRKIKQILQS